MFPAGGRLRHELYIDTGDAERNAELFSALRAQQETIEAAYGRSLTWEELPGRRAYRLADYGEGDVVQAEQYDEYIDWFFDAGTRFRRAMAVAHVTPAPDAAHTTATVDEATAQSSQTG